MATPPRRSLPELEAEAAQLRAGINQAEADWKGLWGDKALAYVKVGDNNLHRLRNRLQVVEMLITRMGPERR